MSEEVKGSVESLKKTAKIIYFLNLASLIFGVTSIIAVIMAYIYQSSENPEWINTHFRWQIRTFWISFVTGIIGVILSFILIGYLVFIFLLIWWIVRNIKGLKWLNEDKPVENPTTYFF